MMKNKNNQHFDSQNRAMCAEEQAQLKYLLSTLLSPKKKLLKAILNTFVLWGAMLLAALLFSGLFTYLATISTLISAFIKLPFIQPLIIIITAGIAFISSYKWFNNSENEYSLVLKDLKRELVVDERYEVQEVCRFQEPQHGGYIYFLKVSEQNVFVIYDYESQKASLNKHTSCDENFIVLNHLILSLTPQSRHCLNYTFSGNTINVSNTYPLNVPPEKWPLPETWSHLPWSQIVHLLS